MGNKKVNYPDILMQEQPPKHLSLSCNSCVKFDIKAFLCQSVYNPLDLCEIFIRNKQLQAHLNLVSKM